MVRCAVRTPAAQRNPVPPDGRAVALRPQRRPVRRPDCSPPERHASRALSRHGRACSSWLALAALFPLVCSLSRMSSFLRATVFTRVPLWVLCLALTLCALAHALSGLNVCAMWALPAVFLVGTVAVLSGLLTAGELRLSRLAAPTAALLPQFRSLLRLLLPGTLILALSAARQQSCRGGLARTHGRRRAACAAVASHGAAARDAYRRPAALSELLRRRLAAIGDFARHGEVFFAVPLILCETGAAPRS